MTTIKLTGGRGTVRGDVVHMNPNYWFLVTEKGQEITVPVHLIRSAKKEN